MGSLAELDYDHTMHERDRAGDDKLYVRFFMDVLPDPEQSAATGMRKFRDAEMVTIMVPGDKRNVITREVRDDDRMRFETKYAQFKSGEGEKLDGFPLKEWSMMTRAMVEEFKYLGFHTVEHVAKASETVVAKYPGLREIQRRAILWLESQKSDAPIQKLESEVKKREEANAALQAQITAMAAEMAKLKAKAG